ncbi:MAG: YjbH domain-containing protein [Gammaproteobacteria bacterium]|jgi:hypothetical protein
MMRRRFCHRTMALVVSGVVFVEFAVAEPSMLGQTGLINMPDARIEDDGTLRFGVGYFDPYLPVWSSVTLLPRWETSFRYTTIDDLSGNLGQGFGDYKDKAFDTKLQLLREDGWRPAVTLGRQDVFGTELFSADFAVLSKRLRHSDYTLGYGTDRIDGWFGGVRYRPPWARQFSLVMEYDANDYENDFRAADSGADERDGGWTYGLEYKKGWLGLQLATQGDDIGVNTHVDIPLMDREFVPKIDEPDPYTEELPQVALEQWIADTDYAARLARALEKRDYKDVRLAFDGHTLSAELANNRISLTGRAVGRAARILLALGPEDTRAIHITYTRQGLPAVTYEFSDTHKLARYFDGLLSREQLNHYLEIRYAEPSRLAALPDEALVLPLDDEPVGSGALRRTDEGHVLSFRRDARDLSSFSIVPLNLGVFLNDPNGAARFDVFATANYTKQLGRARFLDSQLRFSLWENVSEVSQRSNSTLPHVRSDIALYRQRGGRVKLSRLLLNQFLQPAERVYARLSAGYYEEMFAGTGGQLLYLPDQKPWAVDVSLDWLRQRSTKGRFGFRSYDTVTALGAFHYRLPAWGLTATARAGRFLAKDNGVRFELKRRFRSGITLGFWYTRTDGDDITPPGSPGDPYYDKGIFASIPLGPMLTRDTKASAGFSLAPWTRDVGQMVDSPGDLYTLFEETLMLDNSDDNLGSQLGQ